MRDVQRIDAERVLVHFHCKVMRAGDIAGRIVEFSRRGPEHGRELFDVVGRYRRVHRQQHRRGGDDADGLEITGDVVGELVEQHVVDEVGVAHQEQRVAVVRGAKYRLDADGPARADARGDIGRAPRRESNDQPDSACRIILRDGGVSGEDKAQYRK